MRPTLLSTLLLASAALAQGSPPTPRALPASAPVQPGQTWVVSGTTYQGKKVALTLKLKKTAPVWQEEDSDWALTVDTANPDLMGFFYNPADQLILVFDTRGVLAGQPAHMCLGFIEGKQASGLLLSGSLNEIEREGDFLQNGIDWEDLNDGLGVLGAARKAGAKVGPCTMTRR